MEVFIIIFGLILDRITKLWALNSLKNIKDIVAIRNYADLYYLENKGAAWGIFQNKIIFLTIITAAVILGMIYYMYKYRPKSKLFKISFSLIIAGALGNLFDRIYYKHVVDFILLHYKDIYYFPVFNVADIMVVIGTFLLALWLLKDGR